MKIVLACPICGKTEFFHNDDDGSWECECCGEFFFIEEMTAIVI